MENRRTWLRGLSDQDRVPVAHSILGVPQQACLAADRPIFNHHMHQGEAIIPRAFATFGGAKVEKICFFGKEDVYWL